MISNTLYSSKSEEWATPQEIFDRLNEEFHFNLDPCATEENHKCERYFTKRENGLVQSWGGCTVFCNPPYGRKLIQWAKKCHDEGCKPNTIVVMLVPARTDTRWFQNYCLHRAEVRFIKGRVHFGEAGAAPFPSMLVIFRGARE